MSARESGGLRDPLKGTGVPLPADRRPDAGPVAILPNEPAWLLEAVAAAGGEVAPLSNATRGLIWVHASDAAGLADVLDAHPGIGWVQLPWAGVDAFEPVLSAHAADAFPIWTSAKGAYSEPVAEHAVTLALAGLREIPEKARRTTWTPRSGETLFGRRVLILGAGGIAQEIIRLLQPFHPEITIVRRSPGEVDGAARVVTVERIDEVLPDAEVVIVAAASTGETARLFDARRIGLMNADAVFVNIARGAIVDTMALAEALNAGRLKGAGIDVTDPEPLPKDHPLWKAKNIIITPHMSAISDLGHAKRELILREQLRRFAAGDKLLSVVDFKKGY